MSNDGSEVRVDVGRMIRVYARNAIDEFRKSDLDEQEAVRAFLSGRLPGRYGVGEGAVVDTRGGRTKPFGAVIYDRERLPILTGENGLPFWPFESVYAGAEVKAQLTREELERAVENIAAFKRLDREKQTSASGPGFTVSGEMSNPPFGLLVAHSHAEDLVPSQPAFVDIVTSVPSELQIDAYCVISGPLGCRGKEAPGVGLLLGFHDVGPTKLYHFYFGPGALAAFLLMVTTILNKIRLGDPSLLQYLRAATP